MSSTFGLNKPEPRMYIRNFPIADRGFDFEPRGYDNAVVDSTTGRRRGPPKNAGARGDQRHLPPLESPDSTAYFAVFTASAPPEYQTFLIS